MVLSTNNNKDVNRAPFRPKIMEDKGAPGLYNQLMKTCWDEVPENRCQMKEILRIVSKLNREYGL